ncbi:MAG: phosphoribosylamine--glycine ligase [Candidatus Auribacterota bacterium]|jgi:phosphoribosylamine--glycine ligase|nr:phosphoribosylamine--glycine ligase [Candidatus Auribacterota bacterium]
MKVLVVGGGGREHTLVWKLRQSPLVKKIYCAPGNGGISKTAECVPIDADNIQELLAFAKKERIDFTVVGPEVPLTLGIVDLFTEEGLPILGPTKAAAQLEGSKIFAKQIMARANVPTGFYKKFSVSDEAIEYLNDKKTPVVIKADGLAAGKGVIIADTMDKAKGAVRLILDDRIFGESGNQIIIEEFLRGEEASILAFTDGKTVIPLDSSQDHKRAKDMDKGPNTGGMGAYSPAPVVTDSLKQRILKNILEPVVYEMAKAGTPYTGILYAGLMIDGNEPKVLEFNVRFGDPETQALLPRLETDLMEVFLAIYEKRLHEITLKWSPNVAVTVVIASGGYPGEYEKGIEIQGIEDAESIAKVHVFHAGTKLDNGRFYTAGGRVLNVCALGKTIETAQDRAYAAVRRIYFDKMHFRKDIGDKALAKLKGAIHG